MKFIEISPYFRNSNNLLGGGASIKIYIQCSLVVMEANNAATK